MEAAAGPPKGRALPAAAGPGALAAEEGLALPVLPVLALPVLPVLALPVLALPLPLLTLLRPEGRAAGVGPLPTPCRRFCRASCSLLRRTAAAAG